MSASGSLSERSVVCDTVVVNYFLAVGQIELLAETLGGTIRIPRAVFDPEEPAGVADEVASELTKGLRLHRRRTETGAAEGELQARSARALPHFERLPQLCADGLLDVLEMTADELATYAQLRDREHVTQFGLIAALGRGEAAALAIARSRRFDVATDDQDAIRALVALAPDLQVLRIRQLLVDASDRGIISRATARQLHEAMRGAGFWDTGTIVE